MSNSFIADKPSIVEQAAPILRQVPILPMRFHLRKGAEPATAPMLRGVWGRALHDLDINVYQEVFHPQGHRVLPGYIVRPAPPDLDAAPAVEFILVGKATKYRDIALRAWDIASGMGIGKQREPFFIKDRIRLNSLGDLDCDLSPWSLDESVQHFPHGLESQPCCLNFTSPLSLSRNKRLLTEPSLVDIVIKGCRRIGGFLPREFVGQWNQVKAGIVDAAKQITTSGWRGRRVDLKRYSGTQKNEFEVFGVMGQITLPDGPGDVLPLLAALEWLHLGKSTNVGLGQLVIDAKRIA